ncbi:hypothetical protein D3879_09935 [Pseudomonas cavernicola]|uniref:Uncharacterized protein n=1 Tax=Pseudomonas cavernicola TaxID=2320866 RepID=A0A418XM50_9PSED|nr:hypothetical protein D3879_09935 [Pseudomonas cavernicola]
MIAWCNGDAEARYSLAASFVSFKHCAEENGPLAWSEQARALLAHAPDPRSVLVNFVNRFKPMSWSGSRASLMEANTRLLDDAQIMIPAALLPYVAEAKDLLSREIANERQSETERDQVRDERFE